MKYLTYKITNIVNNKSYYGWTNKETIEKRLIVHFWAAKTGKLLLHNAIRKYGENAFIIELINSFATKSEALMDEILLISEHNTNHCRHPNGGYNMTDGGEGASGYKRSKEAIEKTANKNRGKLSPKKGKTYEEIYGLRAESERETRRNSMLALKRTDSLEQKKKRANSCVDNKRGCFPVEVKYSDGIVIIYPSRDTALKGLGIKSYTTLRAIATGSYWKNGKYIKYKSPYDFTIKLLRNKL